MTYSAHARDRMAERGITAQDITLTIKCALHKWCTKDGLIAFERHDIRVIVDPLTMAVVTAIRLR